MFDLDNNRSSQGHLQMVRDLIIQSKQKHVYVPKQLPSVSKYREEYAETHQAASGQSLSEYMQAKNQEYFSNVLVN